VNEGERESVDTDDEYAVTNFAEITGLFELTVLLSAQAHQRMTHQRRYNILSTLIDNPAKVNELLCDQAEIMNDPGNKYLFGEKFEEVLSKSSTAQKKLNEVFTGLKNPVVGKKNQHQNQPFRKGPLPQWTRNSTRGRGQFFLDFPNVHPLVKSLFVIQFLQNIGAATRLKHFAQNWHCLAQNPQILEIVLKVTKFLFIHSQNNSFSLQ